MEYYTKGTLGTSGGPTLRLYENGSMGDIYINQRLRQSPNGYIWKDPSNGSLAIENTEYRKVGSILPKYYWDGMVVLLGSDGILDLIHRAFWRISCIGYTSHD